MALFRDSVAIFHRDICRVHDTNSIATLINTGTLSAIRSESQSLLMSCAFLSRFHYLTHITDRIPLEEALLPLQGLEVLGLVDSIHLFERPGHKDRFCHLIDHLTGTPELFAEILYFALVTPDVSLEGIFEAADLLSVDDRARLIFGTIPALYNFLLADVDINRGLSLVRSLLSLHCCLHDFEFSASHRFLNDIVFSLFLSTNPGRFFEVAVHPLMINLLPAHLAGKETQYNKATSTLVRGDYLAYLVKFCEELLRRMREYVGLLPASALALIHCIAGIDGGQFPVKHLFVFEDMFLAYIRKYVPLASPDIVQDVVQVLHCYYPQSWYPSRLFARVHALFSKDGKSAMDGFFESLIARTSDDDDDLTPALAYHGRIGLFTGRDLSLLYRIVKYFLGFAPPDPLETLVEMISGVAPPQSLDDDKFCALLAWNSCPEKAQPELTDIRAVEDLIELFNVVPVPQLSFATPAELVSQLVRHSGPFLEASQCLAIEAHPELLEQRHNWLVAFRENRNVLDAFGSTLETHLYRVLAKVSQNRAQIARLREIHIEQMVLPALFERHSELAYKRVDLRGKRSSLARIRDALNSRLAQLQFTPDAIAATQRMYYEEFVGHIHAAFRVGGNSRIFASYAHERGAFVATLPPENQREIDSATSLFRDITSEAGIRVALTLIVRAMLEIPRLNDQCIAHAIAVSGNQATVEINLLLTGFLLVETDILSMIVGAAKIPVIHRFSRIVAAIQSNRPVT
jgi:hypothetical protein